MTQVIEATEIQQLMERWAAALERGSLAEPLQSAHAELLEGVADNFARKEDSAGVPWPPRKVSRRYPPKPHPLLRLTHALFASVANDQGAGHVVRMADDGRTLETGSDLDVVPYARAQNLGNPSTNLPAREFLYATDAVAEKIGEHLADGVVELLMR